MRFIYLFVASVMLLSNSAFGGGDSTNSMEERVNKLEKLMGQLVATVGKITKTETETKKEIGEIKTRSGEMKAEVDKNTEITSALLDGMYVPYFP